MSKKTEFMKVTDTRYCPFYGEDLDYCKLQERGCADDRCPIFENNAIVNREGSKISVGVFREPGMRFLKLGFDIPCHCLCNDSIEVYVREISDGVRGILQDALAEKETPTKPLDPKRLPG